MQIHQALFLFYKCFSSHPLSAIHSFWFWHKYWFFAPRGSSKRVSSSTRCRVGSLVPQISLSVMMTCESSVSHSPGPSCTQSGIFQLKHRKISRMNKTLIELLLLLWLHIFLVLLVAVGGKPHLIGGCCGGESTRYPPWYPRLTLCSTLQLSDPDRAG